MNSCPSQHAFRVKQPRETFGCIISPDSATNYLELPKSNYMREMNCWAKQMRVRHIDHKILGRLFF